MGNDDEKRGRGRGRGRPPLSPEEKERRTRERAEAKAAERAKRPAAKRGRPPKAKPKSRGKDKGPRQPGKQAQAEALAARQARAGRGEASSNVHYIRPGGGLDYPGPLPPDKALSGEVIPPGGSDGAYGEAERDYDFREYMDDKEGFQYPGRGRPRALTPDDRTLAQIFELGRMRATMHEAASILLVSHKTFQRFLNECEAAKDAWVQGQDGACVSLRRAQLQAALEGSTAMMVHLGRHWLGQTDKSLEDDPASAEKVVAVDKLEAAFAAVRQKLVSFAESKKEA